MEIDILVNLASTATTIGVMLFLDARLHKRFDHWEAKLDQRLDAMDAKLGACSIGRVRSSTRTL